MASYVDRKAAEGAIEGHIDHLGLDTVLDIIREICYGKAQHLRENWQDEATAQVWDRAGSIVDTASTRPAVELVS